MDGIEENKYIRQLFCQACLSSDRILSSVGEYVEIYRNIANITINPLSQPVYLCWECMAVLRKIRLFKDKIEIAQKILKCHIANKKKTLLKTLSKITKTNTCNTLYITYNDDITKKLDIKQENNDSDHDFNYDLNTNDVCFEEIKKQKGEDISLNEIKKQKTEDICLKEFKKQKTEDLCLKEFQTQKTNDLCVKEIKKENIIDKKSKINNKVSHYRIIGIEVLKIKIPLKPDETKMWLNSDKNSDFYKNFKYKCKMCEQGFDCKQKLKDHILKHDESIGPHKCTTCNMRFNSETSLCAHIQEHNFAWKCARCGFQCYTERRLNSHISTHSAVQCVYCDALFQDLPLFYTHHKLLHNQFLCDHCGKRCKTKKVLEKHMLHHVDTHICSACSRRYKSRAALRKHQLVKHSSARAEEAYCVLCDKQYANRMTYRRHVRSSAAHAHEWNATAIKKYPCPECSNTYSRRTYMMNHYRLVHINQSKHYCSECDRHFLNRTKYLDHMRYKHEGVKRDKNKLCNICGRGFAVNRTLINHIRTHSGERPYECEYCSAKFSQRTSMLSHVKYIHMKSKRRGQWQET